MKVVKVLRGLIYAPFVWSRHFSCVCVRSRGKSASSFGGKSIAIM